MPSKPTSHSTQKPINGASVATEVESPIRAVLERAVEMGLMADASQQIGVRLPKKLVQQAKKRTGITSTKDLLAFALANVALEDNFAAAWADARGKLDPDLDIGF